MISVEMEDVLAVLQLCKPYIIGIVASLVIGIVIMIACRRMCRDKKFLIRREAAIAMVLAVVVCVNMICFGPMATLIGLATGNGTLSDESALMDGEAVADRLTNTCEAEQREQREAMERSLTRDEERIEVLDKMVMRLYEDMIAGRISEQNFNTMLEKTQTEQT